MLISTKSN